MLKNKITSVGDEVHVEIVSKRHCVRTVKFDAYVIAEFERQFGPRTLSLNSNGYVQFRSGGKVTSMNSWFKENFELPGCDDPSNVEVDHIDGSDVWSKKLDYRLANLRLVTSKENLKNRKNKTSIYDVPEPFPGAWAWKPTGIGYGKARGSTGLSFVYQADRRTQLWSTTRPDVPEIDKLLEVTCLAIVYGADRHRADLKAYCELILSHI